MGWSLMVPFSRSKRIEYITSLRILEASQACRKSAAETRTVGPPTKSNRACRNRSSATQDLSTRVRQVPFLKTVTLRVQVPSRNTIRLVWPNSWENRGFSIMRQQQSRTSKTGKRAIQLAASAVEGCPRSLQNQPLGVDSKHLCPSVWQLEKYSVSSCAPRPLIQRYDDN